MKLNVAFVSAKKKGTKSYYIDIEVLLKMNFQFIFFNLNLMLADEFPLLHAKLYLMK